MQNFSIKATENSPYVFIDKDSGLLEISGYSTLHNPVGFYKHLSNWIKAFNLKDVTTHTVNISISQMNADSYAWMIYLIKQLENYFDKTHSMTINWFYDQNNQESLRFGQYCSTSVHVPFTFIPADQRNKIYN